MMAVAENESGRIPAEEVLRARAKMDPKTRWVFTGISIRSPYGGTKESLAAVWEQRSCAGSLYPLGRFKRWNSPVLIGGVMPDFNHTQYGFRRAHELNKGRPRNSHLGIEVAGGALEDAQMWREEQRGTHTAEYRSFSEGDGSQDVTKSYERMYRLGQLDGVNGDDLWVYVGTSQGPSLEVAYYTRLLATKGLCKEYGPTTPNDIITDTTAASIAAAFGLGSYESVNSACTSSSKALGNALRQLAYHAYKPYGPKRAIIVGDETPMTEESIAAFAQLGALTKKHNQTPLLGSRPFDRERSGFVMTELACATVVESLADAMRRREINPNVKIYGEFLGYGEAADRNPHLTLMNGTGYRVAIATALAEAGLQPHHIKYINAHATSTPEGDRRERAIITELFPGVPYASTKGSTLHGVGAIGLEELIIMLMGMQKGAYAAPCTNFFNPDPGFENEPLVLYPTQVPRPLISASFNGAFGGHNTVLITTGTIFT